MIRSVHCGLGKTLHRPCRPTDPAGRHFTSALSAMRQDPDPN